MQGKLMTKSKVIQTMRPKSQVFKRKLKPQRANTPQRWSRRIRSLPPIPINVLKPHRKMRKKCANTSFQRYTSTPYLEDVRKRNHSSNRKRERGKSVFVNKTVANHKDDSVEVVRIVPVVVYVKNPLKTNKTFIPEEIRVHINDNPTCQVVSQAIDSHIHRKTNEEKMGLVKGRSKKQRISNGNCQMEKKVQVKRKYLNRKKMLLYQ